MYESNVRTYKNNKNKYTRELSRLLLVKLPPKNGRSFGLTGNFLPVPVVVTSNRKFKKMKGWYWTRYSVTNKYAKINEKTKLDKVDSSIISRLCYRLWTSRVDEVSLSDVKLNDYAYTYITVLDPDNANLFLFYINTNRKGVIKSYHEHYYMYKDMLDRIKLKKFEFQRFNARIVNYVTANKEILKILYSFF